MKMTGKRKILLGATAFCGLGSVLAFGTAPSRSSDPVIVVETRKLEMMESVLKRRVLLEVNEHSLIKSKDAADKDFRNLYAVTLRGVKKIPAELASKVDILKFVPGKVAVARIEGKDIASVSHYLHKKGMACGALFRLYGDTVKEIALAEPTPIISVDKKDAHTAKMVEDVQVENIQKTIGDMSAIHTRFHTTGTGKTVAEWLIERYKKIASSRNDIEFATYDHGSKTAQPSLVVRFKGQKNPDEIVILGSHIDSVNWEAGSRDSRSPGADDNASGTSTNLEVFRTLVSKGTKFDRTVEIHGYAAEEIGLVGSQHMAGEYKSAKKNVISMMQIDMNLWKDEGEVDKIWFVSNSTNAAFNDQLIKLTEQYVKLPWGKESLWAGSSDHASWNRVGYPAAFPFENPRRYNPSIHTANDTTDEASWGQVEGFAKLAVAYLSHFGGAH